MYRVNVTDGQGLVATQNFANPWSADAAMRWTAYEAKKSGLSVAGDPRSGFSIGPLNIVCEGPNDVIA